MIEIEHSAHSDKPRADVWKILSDLQHWHEWGPWTETTIDGDIQLSDVAKAAGGIAIVAAVGTVLSTVALKKKINRG